MVDIYTILVLRCTYSNSDTVGFIPTLLMFHVCEYSVHSPSHGKHRPKNDCETQGEANCS